MCIVLESLTARTLGSCTLYWDFQTMGSHSMREREREGGRVMED